MPLTLRQANERIGRSANGRTALKRPINRFREGREYRFLEADVNAYVARQTIVKAPVRKDPVREWESFADIANSRNALERVPTTNH